MNLSEIQVGDIVQVDFNNAHITLCRNAIVRHKPVATGDSWIFEARDTGYTYYVSEGCTVSRKNSESTEVNDD